MSTLEKWAERLQTTGDHANAIRLLKTALNFATLHESLYRSLMRSLAHEDRFAECMEVYRNLRLTLWEEMHLQPDPETITLYNALREAYQERAQKQRSPRTPIEAIPEPQKSVPRATTLPNPITPLIGRDSELEEIMALLQDSPIVTISGVGGVGKTRLSLEVAHKVENQSLFADGVVFVSLVALQTPEILPSFIGRALGLSEEATSSISDALEDFFRPREMLLVLDNCEHLIQACAETVFQLLSVAPNLHVLATSRAVLGIGGEQVYPLLPLSVPAANTAYAELAGFPSVRLFIERAKKTVPHFEMVQQDTALMGDLMRQLEGLPLALELAAARLKVLSLQQVTERMSDRFRLLRTTDRVGLRPPPAMEDSVRASYQLLSAEDTPVFRHLCIFTGGFRLDMAEQVCLSADVLEALTHLVESSLVSMTTTKHGETRYVMLETIRQFGADRLREEGEYETLKKRHYQACLDFVLKAREQLTGRDQQLWLHRMDAEQGNWRTALQNASSNQEFANLVNSLLRYWFTAGHLYEGKQWFELALTRLDGVDDGATGRIYNGAGVIAWHHSRFDEGKVSLQKSVALARSVGDLEALAHALNNLSLVTRALFDNESALDAGREALECYRAMKDDWGTARTLSNLGQTADILRRREVAKEYYRQAMVLFEKLGEARGIAYVTMSLAETEIELGHFGAAQGLLEKGIRGFHALEDLYQLAWCLDVMVDYVLALGDTLKATYLHLLFSEFRLRLGSIAGTEERPRPTKRTILLEVLGSDRYEQIALECKEWTVERAVDFALELCALPPPPDANSASENNIE